MHALQAVSGNTGTPGSETAPIVASQRHPKTLGEFSRRRPHRMVCLREDSLTVEMIIGRYFATNSVKVEYRIWFSMSTDSIQIPEFDDKSFYIMLLGSIGGTFGVLIFGSVISLTLIQAVATMFLLEITAMLVTRAVTHYM